MATDVDRKDRRPGRDVLAVLMEHKRVVRSYIDKRVANRSVVDDLVAETYLVAWRRLAEVPDDREHLVAWLCGVARNIVRNHVRGELRRRRLVERMADHTKTLVPASAGADGAPGLQRLVAAHAWGELSPHDRQLLAWTAAGWTNDQIAVRLGIRSGAVAMRLARARSRLAAHAAV